MPGIPIGVAPGVTRVVAGNASLMTGPGTNTFLLGTRELAVVDPGPDDAAHLGAILVPVERHVWAQLTLEAHLLKLSAEGRVSRHDGLWRLVST